MKTITEAFPPLPLDELILSINAFKETSIHIKRKFISKLVKHHPLLSVEWGSGSLYHRARNMGENVKPITHIKEILCPPKEKRSFGRIDSIDHEILYMAYGRNTAFNELKVRDNSARNYAVATFEIYKSLRVLPIGELSRTQITGKGILTGNVSTSINDMLNACPRNEAIRLLITDKFLSECLMSDDYQITSYVSSCIFKKQPNISAISYPSNQFQGGYNFAVRNSRLWESFKVKAIRHTQARHLACGYFEERCTRHVIGIENSGALIWDQYSSNNESYMTVLDPAWAPEGY